MADPAGLHFHEHMAFGRLGHIPFDQLQWTAWLGHLHHLHLSHRLLLGRGETARYALHAAHGWDGTAFPLEWPLGRTATATL
jgi:hypothetical protein